jgi:PKD repeat protein
MLKLEKDLAGDFTMNRVLIVLACSAIGVALSPVRLVAGKSPGGLQGRSNEFLANTGKFGPTPAAAVVDFSATPTSGAAPLVVSFTDLSDIGPTSWKWDFGDGGISREQNPTHVYNSPGAFSVKLKAAGPSAAGVADKEGFITVASSTAEFAPASFAVVAGSLKSGDASSLAASDGNVLKLKSVMLDGSFGDIIEYGFNTTLKPTAASIAFAVFQRTSVAPQQEKLSVFNFSTGAFDVLATGTLSIPVDTITTLDITNPVPYISAAGEVRLQVRVGDSGTTRWKHLVDQVKLTSGR